MHVNCVALDRTAQVPLVVPKKVPYEECRSVPAIDCFLVLKTVVWTIQSTLYTILYYTF